MSPASAALPPSRPGVGASGWGGLIGRQGGLAGAPRGAARPHSQIIVGQILRAALPIVPGAGGEPGPPAARASLRRCHGLPAGAIMDAPFGGKWTAREASPLPGPPRPGCPGCPGCGGPQVADGRRITGGSLPAARRGVKSSVYLTKDISGMPPGAEGAASPLRPGGWGAGPEPGRGLPGGCCHGTALGSQETPSRGPGRSWGVGLP